MEVRKSMPSLRELMSHQSPGAIRLCDPYSPSVIFPYQTCKSTSFSSMACDVFQHHQHLRLRTLAYILRISAINEAAVSQIVGSVKVERF
jgi:hypothetical protein